MGIIPQNSLRTPVVQHRPGGTAPPNLPQRRCDTGPVASFFLAFQPLLEGDGDGPGERLARELRQLHDQPMGVGVLDVQPHSRPLWSNFSAFLPFIQLATASSTKKPPGSNTRTIGMTVEVALYLCAADN